MDNPFECYDLDPHAGIEAITARLKELAEDTKDDAERDAIRAAWEELTMHPARRLRAALLAFPETRPAVGAAPIAPRRAVASAPITLDDLAVRPRIVAPYEGEWPPPPSLADDPLL